jgi:hypothetical protein
MASKCGAKTRAGGRCQQAGMPNGRCRYHGGLSTGPKPGSQNNLKHGMYAKHMTDEEIAISRAMKLGNVDQELRLTRIRLRRALDAEEAAQGKPELEEVTEHDLIGQEGSRQDVKSKMRDYVGIIDRLTARIESLEKTRRELVKSAEDADEDKTPIGRIIVEVVGAKSSPDHDRAAG